MSGVGDNDRANRQSSIERAWDALLAGDVERAAAEVANSNNGYRVIAVFGKELRYRFGDAITEWLDMPQPKLNGDSVREHIYQDSPNSISHVMRLLWPEKFERPPLLLYARDYRPVEGEHGFLETRAPNGRRIDPLDLHEHDLPPAIERAAWREAVPVGWYGIYDRLMLDLERVAPGFRLSQVKEKLGGLRVYTRVGPKKADAMTRLRLAAEKESYRTCAVCAAPAGLCVERGTGFLITLCDNHSAGFDPYARPSSKQNPA